MKQTLVSGKNGSGGKAKNRKQVIAIVISEARGRIKSTSGENKK